MYIKIIFFAVVFFKYILIYLEVFVNTKIKKSKSYNILQKKLRILNKTKKDNKIYIKKSKYQNMIVYKALYDILKIKQSYLLCKEKTLQTRFAGGTWYEKKVFYRQHIHFGIYVTMSKYSCYCRTEY